MWKRWWSRPPATAEPPPPRAEPTDEELIERTARAIVERRLAAPAAFLLESSKPVSFIASQGLVVLGPFIDAALDVPDYEAFVRMTEQRENLERLLLRIEALEDERLGAADAKQGDHPPDEEQKAHGPLPD